MDKHRPIGVLDAGMGGLTVVKELQRLLPHEDIVFFGEGVNQPYGNREEEEILHLIAQCFDFMESLQVKTVAVGCNTISTLIEKYQDNYDFRIFSIVQAGSDLTASMGLDRVGMLSTLFTAQSGCYERLIHEKQPDMKIVPQGSRYLAQMLERPDDYNEQQVEQEIRLCLDELLGKDPDIRHLILGCTHFPFVADNIRRMYPGLSTINPAIEVARQVADYLEAEGGLNDQQAEGTLRLFATIRLEAYQWRAGTLGIRPPAEAGIAPAPKPWA